MKRFLKTTNEIDEFANKLSDSLQMLIVFEMWGHKSNHGRTRRQFTVNGRKYLVKDDVNRILHIINPEGEDLCNQPLPERVSNDTVDLIVDAIIVDAFGIDEKTKWSGKDIPAWRARKLKEDYKRWLKNR